MKASLRGHLAKIGQMWGVERLKVEGEILRFYGFWVWEGSMGGKLETKKRAKQNGARRGLPGHCFFTHFWLNYFVAS